jgi:hypothetical protein
MKSGEQGGTRFGEPHIGAALVQPEPAFGDGAIEPGLVLGGRALQLIDPNPATFLNYQRN